MQIHRGVLEQINNFVLPYALRINGVGVPYPAELWVDGEIQHEDGTAIFGINDGRFTVEFFVESHQPDYFYLFENKVSLVLKNARIEVPVSSCRPSEKTREMYAGRRLWQQGYECGIQGWVGGNEDTQMRSAVLTIANLPRSLPDEGLVLKAGAWVITLHSCHTHSNRESEFLYYAVLTRQDDEPFTLSDSDLESGVIAALRNFLSFQCGYWVCFPTIVCHPPREEHSGLSQSELEKKIVEQSLVERAWIGQLTSQLPDSPSRAWTATDVSDWAGLMPEFWRLYDDPDLKHSVKYYVQSSRLLDIDMEYAFVAMRSTLEALMRWWGGSSGNNRLGSKAFIDGLQSAIKEADLGLESEKRVDIERLKREFEESLNRYRNNIAHAHRLDNPLLAETIADGHGFQWHLARMLILAKLGHRKADSRGRFGMPTFVER